MSCVFGAIAGAITGAIVSHILCEAHFKAIDKIVKNTMASVKETCIGFAKAAEEKINLALHKKGV